MAKKLEGEVKFQVPGGQATPAPPVGTSLGRFGINLGQFVQQFNDKTKDAGGMPIPVVVRVYNDRSFDFDIKSPPAAALLKQAAGIAKGSGVPNRDKVGKVTVAQLEEIVNMKKVDLNARDMENARHMIEAPREAWESRSKGRLKHAGAARGDLSQAELKADIHGKRKNARRQRWLNNQNEPRLSRIRYPKGRSPWRKPWPR